MVLRQWATRDLRHGDLTTLGAIATGLLIDAKDSSIRRLQRRHFVFVKPDGQIILSFRDQMALMIRRRMRRRKSRFVVDQSVLPPRGNWLRCVNFRMPHHMRSQRPITAAHSRCSCFSCQLYLGGLRSLAIFENRSLQFLVRAQP